MRKLLALLVAVSLSAAAQVTLVDQAGREVTLPGQVERVVSLYGVATLYLYPLGQQGKLVLGPYVGLKPGSLAWEALLTVDPGLPGKYSRHKATLEEVLAAGPDLVLGKVARDLEVAQQLSRFDVPTLLLDLETLDRIKEAVSLLGTAFGVPERASTLLSYFDEQLGEVEAAVAAAEKTRPRVLFVGTSPFRVASGDMFQSEMIALAGGTSVTAGLGGYWQDVNTEQILLWDPEVVFIAPYGKVSPEDLLSDPVWGGVAAVEAGRVYKMPRVISPWDVPTPESILGIMWMAARLHPELPLDVVGEARAFYRAFFGYELSEELAEEIGR
ncbi:ABC transporter substrate-binding protein [Candidatus Bipolaricaulota bacterium]|nr:ABC transporter substrate-binding protein [Candidatus Bipolaricaulota bacterium]